MRPVGRDVDEHAAGGLDDLAGDLDQERSPRGQVAFPKRVFPAAAVVIAASFRFGQGGDRGAICGWKSVDEGVGSTVGPAPSPATGWQSRRQRFRKRVFFSTGCGILKAI